MHTKIKGGVAELFIAQHFLQNGWTVSFPFGELSRYDLIAEKNGKFFRIQVKYVTPKKGSLIVNCKSSNNWSVLSYSDKDIDLIAAFDSLHSKAYFIPVSKIGKSTLTLRLETAKNQQIKKIILAEQFALIPEA